MNTVAGSAAWVPDARARLLRRVGTYGAAVATLVLVLCAVRLRQVHQGLLYPDGYQYLLMARGIGEHFRPITQLGPFGDTFVPNVDAGAKPFFPFVLAVLHAFGVPWLDAARAVALAAALLVPPLAGLLAFRLTDSRIAAGTAALVTLASPSLGYWSGFSGPDPLAQALALGAAAALVDRRPRLGGCLAALCVATRPEYLLPLLAWTLGALAGKRFRAFAVRAVTAGAGTLALVMVVLRPPVGIPPGHWMLAIGLGVPASAVLFRIRAAPLLRWLMPAAALAAGVLLVSLASGARDWVASDWPLLGVAAAVLAGARPDQKQQAAILRIITFGSLLALLYWVKNPGLERYFTQLVPLVAVSVAVGIAALPRNAKPLAVLAVVAAAAVALTAAPANPKVGNDMFQGIARRVQQFPNAPLITAAPEAYGFWLPNRSIHELRPGLRGLVLLDAAQRAYLPGLTARGRIVARIPTVEGFRRPDGGIDRQPVIVVDGIVVERHR